MTPQQGKAAPVRGANFVVPPSLSGTLVELGGHLHPGGLEDQVSVVRHGVQKRIFDSDAVYWNRRRSSRGDGQIDSWDLSMTMTGAPLGWKVKIRPNDILRLNAVYDSQLSSWYEDMGIVVAFVAPHDPHGPPGIDPFGGHVRVEQGVPTTVRRIAGWRRPTCHPRLTGARQGCRLGRACLLGSNATRIKRDPHHPHVETMQEAIVTGFAIP